MNLFETEAVSQSEVKIGSVKIKTSTDLSKIKNKKLNLVLDQNLLMLLKKKLITL